MGLELPGGGKMVRGVRLGLLGAVARSANAFASAESDEQLGVREERLTCLEGEKLKRTV